MGGVRPASSNGAAQFADLSRNCVHQAYGYADNSTEYGCYAQKLRLIIDYKCSGFGAS